MFRVEDRKIKKENKLIIIDDNSIISEVNYGYKTLFWRKYSYKNDKNFFSIVELVEKNADKLKNKYLAWVYELGKHKINGKSVIDHLEIDENLSYWWATSVAQKFNCSSISQINDCIKLFALEDFIKKHKIKSIYLKSSNRNLNRTVSKLCFEKNIFFNSQILNNKIKNKFTFKQIIPDVFQAFIYLVRYLYRSVFLNPKSYESLKKNSSNIIFFDVFTHLDKSSYTNFEFKSNYWTTLVEKLGDLKLTANWAHIFFKHPLTKKINIAQQLTKKFTNSSRNTQYHFLLEQRLSLTLLIKILRNYFFLRSSYKKLKKIATFRTLNTNFDLWIFHENEWKKSLIGSDAMDFCIKLTLFSSLLKIIPKQKVGVYISENQPWEIALINKWRYHGHGKIIGTPHTTIRYWDLRYFYDKRSYINKKNNLLLPDYLAVNGPVAKKILLQSNYPKDVIKEVEALRFIYLSNPINLKIPKNKNLSKKIKVLVCGDFNKNTNNVILDWVSKLKQFLPNNYEITLKPHPAYPISFPKKYFFKISNLPLPNLLKDSDLVITSNITSAAVDAYCFGLPVIQLLDGVNFNTSPLLDFSSMYARNAEELAKCIKNIELGSREPAREYFNLNPSLNSWVNLINMT